MDEHERLAKLIAAETKAGIASDLGDIKHELGETRTEVRFLGETLKPITRYFQDAGEEGNLPHRVSSTEQAIVGIVTRMDAYDAATVQMQTQIEISRRTNRTNTVIAVIGGLFMIASGLFAIFFRH